MFPVTKKYFRKYHVEGNKFAILIQNIITTNTHKIVSDCQNYLDEYAKGNRPKFSTNIDYLITQLFSE